MTLDSFDLYELEGEIYDLEDAYDYDSWEEEDDDSYADSEWLSSAGWGTDEDYGYYSDDF